MFWEMYQMRQIGQANTTANRAKLKSEQMENYLELMDDKISSLALAWQSMWEVIRESTDITQEQLMAKMEEVDLRDGRQDGKLSKSVEHCEKCKRKTSRRRRVCIYCGESNTTDEVFGLQ